MIVGTLVAVVVLVIVCLVGVFTHESHLRQIRYQKDEINTCIEKGHLPLECRTMVFGTGN